MTYKYFSPSKKNSLQLTFEINDVSQSVFSRLQSSLMLLSHGCQSIRAHEAVKHRIYKSLKREKLAKIDSLLVIRKLEGMKRGEIIIIGKNINLITHTFCSGILTVAILLSYDIDKE